MENVIGKRKENGVLDSMRFLKRRQYLSLIQIWKFPTVLREMLN